MRAAALFLIACTSPVDITPVIDIPVDDPEATTPMSKFDSIVLEAAHQGHDEDLVKQVFAHGQTLSLANVPLADDLVIHMTGVISTSTVSYGRTCQFSAVDGASPHLFFSNSQFFATLGDTPAPRLGGTGFTYHDGSGLLVGGTDASGAAIVDVDRFDPQTGERTTVGQIAPRMSSIVTSVGEGTSQQVLVLSGTDPMTGTAASFLELVEADTSASVTRVDDPRIARADMTATALSDGRVITIGGVDMTNLFQSALYFIKLDDNGVLQIAISRGVLSSPRRGHTATRLGDDVGAAVLVAGGLDSTGAPVALGELFKPLDDQFADPATFHPTMIVPRSRHHAERLPDGSVVIVGGVDATGTATRVVERFAVDTGFVKLEDGSSPGMPPPTLPTDAPTLDFTTTPLPDGRVLITGGRVDANGPPIAKTFIISLDTNDDTVDILPTHDLAVARVNPQTVLLCDGTVLVSGGTDTPVPDERYNPPATNRR